MAASLLEQIDDDVDGQYDPVFGFAESVTGPSGAILGIFDNEYYQSDAGGSVLLSSALPVLRTRDADAVAQGGAITIRGVDYVVAEVKPNGFGETIHRLQLA